MYEIAKESAEMHFITVPINQSQKRLVFTVKATNGGKSIPEIPIKHIVSASNVS